MTNQLREALERLTPLVDPTDEWYSMLGAARAWSEFPADAQVEAAAQAIYVGEWGEVESWGDHPIDPQHEYRVIARAALEAARNHTNRKEAK